MLKENWGKIVSSVGTAVVLAIFWAFYGLIVTAIEVKAEEYAKDIINEVVEGKLVETTKQLEQTQIQLKGTRTQVNELQQSLEQNNRMLEILIRQTAPNPQ